MVDPDNKGAVVVSEPSEPALTTPAAPAGTGREPPEEGPSREELLLEKGARAGLALRDHTLRWWRHLRFLLLGFYLFFVAVVFWTMLVRAVFIVIHTLLRGVIRLLEFLGGGGPRSARRHIYPAAPVDLWVRKEAVRWWHHLRFIAFAAYLFVAAVGFWLWAIAAVLNGIRLLSSGLAIFFSWVAGRGRVKTWGMIPEATRQLWSRRMHFYRDVARPIARGYVSTRTTAVRFWRWGTAHKLAAVVATVVFVGGPALYLVPRPHYVQILDDNVLQHQNTPNGIVRYLIHAVALDDPKKHYEYENERAAHLGKVDPQGLKNKLVPGRYYRLWVVGIRWYWLPTLFPNIISATEVDRDGNRLESPTADASTQATNSGVP